MLDPWQHPHCFWEENRRAAARRPHASTEMTMGQPRATASEPQRPRGVSENAVGVLAGDWGGFGNIDHSGRSVPNPGTRP